ncbi:hypothetical protein [Thermoflavimicrobium daqui]|uniref:Lipoprotein n=1 Tax=Thermoflavimicrobium daqui TaxID=2137476 RepID=A0A364K4Y9_9BACL|nr:hypothetical protein [Thermoflavimicrobium daqui]RAL24444.1 hypothetical protein DL897_08970 [Thermoflavimicrobium daqui]
MIRKGLALISILSLLLIFSGCSEAVQNNKTTASKETTTEKKEPSIIDILAKAEEAMKKEKGYTYSMDMEFDMPDVKDGSFKTHLDMKATTNPEVAHAIGKMEGKAEGLELGVPVEMYFTKDESYISVMNQWIKEKTEPSARATGSVDQSTKDIVKLVNAAGKDSKGIKFSSEKGIIKIEFDQQASSNDEFKKAITEFAMESIKEQLEDQENQVKDLSNLKINDMKVAVEIDEKTMEFKRQQIEYNVSLDKQSTITMKVDFKVTGKYDGTITIPESIKKNAISESQLGQ